MQVGGALVKVGPVVAAKAVVGVAGVEVEVEKGPSEGEVVTAVPQAAVTALT